MSFVTLSFLWGGLLIGVPVALHLMMRQKPRQLIFPALRFIRQREHANRRRLRFRHLLLLLLRCLAILLLAAALARPSIKATGLIDQEAPIAAALVFDTSPRMEYHHENQTRLAEAQEMATWLLTQLPRGSEIGVLDSGASNSLFSANAKQRIERLAITPASQPLSDEIEDAIKLLSTSDKPRKEVYVFSDLSRASWTPEVAARVKKQLAAFQDTGLYVIDVGALDPQDFGLEDLRLSPGSVISKNSPLRLNARLTRVGPKEERKVTLYLLDADGKPVVREQQTALFDPQTAQQIEFQIGEFEAGTHQGYLKIDGEDALAADDTRYFTVDVRAPWRVLMAAPKPAERYARFLQEAIAPEAFVKKGTARFSCEVVSFDQLSEKNLEDYAAVCLLDPPPLAVAAWEQLTEYAEHGGGVALWLGHNAHEADAAAFNDDPAAKLLPGKLVRQWQGQEAYLTPQHLEHPLLAKFKPLGDAVPWNDFPVYQFWQIDPAPGDNVVIAYNNGKPALLERSIGKGRVLLMTTPISDPPKSSTSWNRLMTGLQDDWPSVMLSNEMLLYLVQRGDERLQYDPGETVVVRLDPDQRQAIFSLATPRQEHLPQSIDQKEGTLTINATAAVGNYQLEAGGDNGVHRGFSVNLKPDAAQLERIDPAELTALFDKTEFRLARDRKQIDRAMSVGRVGVELYPYLMLALALALALEQILANRFYRSGPPSQPPPKVSLATPASEPALLVQS